MNKTKAKVLLIIISVVFALIPIASFLFGKLFKFEEGLTVNLSTYGDNDSGIKLGLIEDGDDSEENTQIDRIKTSDDKYNYCIGSVKCNSGTLEKDDSEPYTLSDGTKVGYTYKQLCNDDTTSVVCEGASAISKFYGPFDGLPVVFQASGNNLTISDVSPDEVNNNNDNDNNNSNNNNNNSDFKCLADNGAVPGDPLCCGQSGVVQNTDYNCPSEYPYCKGYKCGETWGRCSKTSA